MSKPGTPDERSTQTATTDADADVMISRVCLRCERRFDITTAGDTAWTMCPACRASDQAGAPKQSTAGGQEWIPVGGYFG
jgi:hypothetical protein